MLKLSLLIKVLSNYSIKNCLNNIILSSFIFIKVYDLHQAKTQFNAATNLSKKKSILYRNFQKINIVFILHYIT